MQHSVSIALCKQENTLYMDLNTLSSLFVISQVKECVTQTLQILQILRDPQPRVTESTDCTELRVQSAECQHSRPSINARRPTNDTFLVSFCHQPFIHKLLKRLQRQQKRDKYRKCSAA